MRKLLVRLIPVFIAAMLFGSRMPGQLEISNLSLIAPSIAAAQDVPKPDVPKPDVDVNVKVERGRVWYTDPMILLLVAGGGVVLLIALVALASRGGGGTTIIREK